MATLAIMLLIISTDHEKIPAEDGCSDAGKVNVYYQINYRAAIGGKYAAPEN
jgi:hypothetical protein